MDEDRDRLPDNVQSEYRHESPPEEQAEQLSSGLPGPSIRAAAVEEAIKEAYRRQNLFAGIVGGIIGAVLGAVVWATVAYLTGYLVGYVAIGVGFLAGIGVRLFGGGVTRAFGFVGAILAGLGLAAGNVLAACAIQAHAMDVALTEILSIVNENREIVFQILKDGFEVIDILFYGLAIYTGFASSFKEIKVV